MGRLNIEKNRKRHPGIVIFVILMIILFAGAGIYVGFGVSDIKYTGSKHYSDEQLNDYIFSSEKPNALMYTLFGNKNKKIPFVQKYDVEINWPNKMVVTVYEKAIIGYINYMGCNMYFDKDGIVVESSSEVYKGVPQISGLSFKSIVLDSKLDVGNDAIFDQILEITQAFDKYSLDVKKVYFDSSNEVTLYVGEVKVMLGNCTECMDKLYALKQMYDQLTGLKGTLHMEDYNGNSTSIIFKKEN